MIILGATDNPILVILILLLVFGSIAIAVFFARKYVPFLRDDDKKLSDEEAARQTLERFLVPIKEEEKETVEELNKDDITKDTETTPVVGELNETEDTKEK